LGHDWIDLICNGEDSDGKTVLKGKISIGPTIEDNFGFASTNPIDLICLGNTGVHHSIVVGKDQNTISDVNGLKFSYNEDGITITDWVESKAAHILWET
jgi:hypothetical protein